MSSLGRSIGVACLVFALAPCHAESFADDAWNSLYLTSMLAEQVRGDCSELDPSLGLVIDASLARLRTAHPGELETGRDIARRRAGGQGLIAQGTAQAERFTRLLQQEDGPARRTRCARLAAQLEASARRSRAELAQPSFDKWFAAQQREHKVDCARMDGLVRSLARRLVADAPAAQAMDRLRVDALGATRGANWCLDAQAAAAREGIRVPGNFKVMAETAQAISGAAMPTLSGQDAAAAQAQGRERARQYLAQPNWL